MPVMSGWEILVNDWEFMEEFSLFNCIVRIPGIDYCEKKNKDCRAEAGAEAEEARDMSYDERVFFKQIGREVAVTYVVRATQDTEVFYGVLMGEHSAFTHITK